jgi:hypothetical protein
MTYSIVARSIEDALRLIIHPEDCFNGPRFEAAKDWRKWGLPILCLEGKKTVLQNGRHRIAAMSKEGIQTVPFLFSRGGANEHPPFETIRLGDFYDGLRFVGEEEGLLRYKARTGRRRFYWS